MVRRYNSNNNGDKEQHRKKTIFNTWKTLRKRIKRASWKIRTLSQTQSVVGTRNNEGEEQNPTEEKVEKMPKRSWIQLYGRPKNSNPQKFGWFRNCCKWSYAYEVTRKNGLPQYYLLFQLQFCLLLASDKIVIPKKLMKQVMEALLFEHPGSTIILAESSLFWWFVMKKDLENRCSTCTACMSSGKNFNYQLSKS